MSSANSSELIAISQLQTWEIRTRAGVTMTLHQGRSNRYQRRGIASTVDSAVITRSAEGQGSASTVGGAMSARSAGAASVSMGGGAVSASTPNVGCGRLVYHTKRLVCNLARGLVWGYKGCSDHIMQTDLSQ